MNVLRRADRCTTRDSCVHPMLEPESPSEAVKYNRTAQSHRSDGKSNQLGLRARRSRHPPETEARSSAAIAPHPDARALRRGRPSTSAPSFSFAEVRPSSYERSPADQKTDVYVKIDADGQPTGCYLQ